jgi:hypothetical protein
MSKRKRQSKFDPYITEISDLLDTGLSVSKVADIITKYFKEPVDSNALYVFVKSRNLDIKVTQGGRNKRHQIPNCKKCKDCMFILNTCDKEVLVCTKEKRLISKSCKTSPMWCSKRKEN